MPQEMNPQHTAAMMRQIGSSLQHSSAFRALPTAEQARVHTQTRQIADMLDRIGRSEGDPFAMALEDDGGGVANKRKGAARIASSASLPPSPLAPQVPGGANNANQVGFNADAAMAGTRAAGNMVREVNFTAFVAGLVKGVFEAIVQSSIEQMKAYGELVQSVVGSTNEFRDQNVDDGQAADHLQARYPNIFQISVGGDGARRATPRKRDFESGELPSFAELGITDSFSDLDQETIDSKLIPAAKADLSANRQKMLATMVLMGINRIIVTDGRINAKVRFDFTARDSVQRKAMAMDYANLGTTVVETEGGTTTNPGGPQQGAPPADPGADPNANLSRQITTGAYAYVEKPEIKLTGMSQTQSQGELQSQAMMMGEVAINFRSETFPLERMVDSGQMMRLQDLQGGRGAPPVVAPNAPAAPASPTPPA